MDIKANKLRWATFCDEFTKLAATWLVAVIFLTSFRIFFISHFSSQLDEGTISSDIITTLIAGFKFDSAMSGIFLVIPFLTLIILLPFSCFKAISTVRNLFARLFFVFNLALCAITITYFEEYNEQFNHFVFEALYDDQVAIFQTIIKQYNPFISFLIYVGWLLLSLFLLKIIDRKVVAPKLIKSLKKPWLKVIVATLALVLLIVASRGSLSSRPAMRKWADVTADQFLNKTVITPARSLIYAWKDFNSLHQGGKNPFIDIQDLTTVAEKLYGQHHDSKQLSDYLKHHTNGALIETPDHIFLVVMESYDAWPLQDKYADLHITDRVKALGKKGLHFTNFLPSSSSTMNSLSSIISGVPYTGVNVSRLGAIGGPSIASAFTVMKRLGYHTNFFYGGLPSWQNLGNYVANQGADNIYTAVHAGGKSKAGIWGIDDDQLFELVLDKVSQHPKTFNIIMTTTYHGPFTLDVTARGYPYHSNNDYPESIKKLDDGSIEANTLGHLWFADKAIGDFVDQAEEKWPSSLFALTGDHFGRRYFNSKPNLYEISAVPFILYGENITPSLIDSTTTGSHLDMIPTLVELIAPKGFSYSSFGDALQHKSPDNFAYANKLLMGNKQLWKIKPDRYLEFWQPNKHQKISWDQLKENTSLQSELDYNKKKMGLAWHYIMNGEKLTAE